MVDSVTIGVTETLYFLVCVGIVFATSLSPITMWNYWTDTLYSAHDSKMPNKMTSERDRPLTEDSQTKALTIARIKSGNMWATWGLLIFDVVGKCFLVASFYQIIAVYGPHNPGSNYTTMFVLQFIVIGLDKGIPPMIHYFSFERCRIACSIYGVVNWAFTIICLGFLFAWSNNNYAGGLFIPYAAYNTAANVTMWFMFWGKSAYLLDSKNQTRKSGPSQPF